MKDIDILINTNKFGNIVVWNLRINLEEKDEFEGKGYIESRSFLTKIEAEIAAICLEAMFYKSNIKEPRDFNFDSTLWKTLVKSICLLLDTPNKYKDF